MVFQKGEITKEIMKEIKKHVGKLEERYQKRCKEIDVDAEKQKKDLKNELVTSVTSKLI